MHIAQIAPLQEAIPPKLYGGTKRVVRWLTEDLLPAACSLIIVAMTRASEANLWSHGNQY
jgi:hypothetical protein